MAIAAPLLAECRPISFSENPRISGPSVLVALCNYFSTCCPVKWCKDPSGRQNTFTGVSADDDVYEMIRRIILHQIFTGQRSLSPVLWCVIMSFLVSRFCCSKVMEIESARCSNLSEWGRFLFPRKNLMFLMQMSFVFVPMNSSHIALSIGDMDILWYSRRMEPVTAACGFVGLSVTWYPLSWRCRMNASHLSVSSLGSARSANL